MDIIIRKANVDDARSVVEVNTYTWLTTYKGLMPDTVLKIRLKTMDQRIPKMAESIKEKNNVYVAVKDNKVIGIMTYGPSRNENYATCGEIYSIYVLEDYQGLGIGTKLFKAGIKELVSAGYHSMILNVLEGNSAIHFYEKMGGVKVEIKEDKYANTVLVENIMYFDNLE